MLFTLAAPLVSPKFFRKLSYVDTLSQLASVVPLTQIDVPPDVYRENAKREAHITLPSQAVSTQNQVFGVSLEELMGYHADKGVPRVVADVIGFFEYDQRPFDTSCFSRRYTDAELRENA